MEAFHVKHANPAPSPASAATALPPALAERLELYAQLLRRWNGTVQLVSSRDLDHLWDRHIRDALQLLPLIPPGLNRAIDLGSGGGLPGLVLALATGIRFELVESDLRKAAFLREAAAQTGAPVTVHACRIEDVALAPAPLVTARALAPLPRLLALAYPLLADGGLCLFPKGQRFQAEIDAAACDWSMTLQTVPSGVAPGAQLLLLRDLRPKGLSS
ncbi:ribosomal RNA small subunit methyltransferase G [Acidisoma sp. C75]